MRTPDKKDATTKPSARPPCAVTPRSVSVAKLRPESCVTVKAMSNAATRVPANMGISNDKLGLNLNLSPVDKIKTGGK